MYYVTQETLPPAEIKALQHGFLPRNFRTHMYMSAQCEPSARLQYTHTRTHRRNKSQDLARFFALRAAFINARKRIFPRRARGKGRVSPPLGILISLPLSLSLVSSRERRE